MALVLHDTFTAADNTLLSVHTPEYGSWVHWPFSSVEANSLILSNRLDNNGAANDSANSSWRAGDQTLSADYGVKFSLYYSSSTRAVFYPAVRMQAAARTCYVAIVYCSTGQIQIYRCISGVFTSIGTVTLGAWTLGAAKELAMSVSGVGATVTVSIELDGTQVIAAYDTHANRIVSTGYGGFWISGASGVEIDEAKVGPVADLNATDATAPTLTNATATATGETTATGFVTTDEDNGTLYSVVTTSATKPSAAQVKAGQSHTGSAAPWADDQAVSSIGAKSISATGLIASTAYYFHHIHEDAAENQSDVASSASFTTATPDTTAPTLTSPTATATGMTTAIGSVSTNEGNGALYWLTNTSATATATAVKAGSSTAVSATGTQSVSITGLSATTSYYTHFLHRDASGNDSTISTTAQFTTEATPELDTLFIVGDSTSAAYSGKNAVSSYLDTELTITDIAVPGDTINQQKYDWLALDSEDKLAASAVIVMMGLNDLNPVEAASVALSRLQSLIDEIAGDVTADCDIIIAQMTPCRARLITLYGATNGPIAYQKWLDMNAAIEGLGVNAITGVNGRVRTHVVALNDGSGNLAAVYNSGDGIHPNNAGREIIAQAWQYALDTLAEGGTAQISATTSASSTSAVSATVTTDTSGGTIYGVLSESATEMDAADIKSGADDTATVTTAGDYSLNGTGLATWTQYYWHIVHEDADGLMSNVLTIPVRTLDVAIPLAFSDTAPATLLGVQVWSKMPTKAEVEGLY